MTTLASLIVIAYHGTAGAGDGNPLVLVFFLGAAATVGWLLFSRLRWRNTVMVAVGGWLAGLAVTFGF